MAFHHFEIGFDFNAPDGLNIGIVNLRPGSPPQVQTGIVFGDFEQEDYFCFNGFNMTNGADLFGYAITDGSVTFQIAADAPIMQTAISPIGQPSLVIDPLGQAFETGSPLSFSGGPFPLWAPVVPLVQVVSAGRFQFTVSLTVQGPGGAQTFQVDPEMIVQATPPIDDQESLLATSGRAVMAILCTEPQEMPTT